MTDKPMIYETIQGMEPLSIDISGTIYEVHGYSLDSLSHLFIDEMLHQEVTYDADMPGMTLDEFQAWSDQVIPDATSPRPNGNPA